MANFFPISSLYYFFVYCFSEDNILSVVLIGDLENDPLISSILVYDLKSEN